jgi:signal transduction histidine kinase
MEDEINILRRLLDDLTGLYDQFVGSFIMEFKTVDLQEWLSALLLPQREAAQSKGLIWKSTVSDDLPKMNIDPGRLSQALGNLINNALKFTPAGGTSQALGNLINNALKFTPAGGTVEITAGRENNEIWIAVQDSGPGIPLEDQENIFTPFFRGRSETRFPQGMGLGLSIARDLVMAHQGKLTFESTPGEGSRFIIWLPDQ